MTTEEQQYIEEQIKAGIRQLMAERGRAVEFKEPWWEGDTQERVSTFGWRDTKLEDHVHPWQEGKKGCSWVVPEGIRVKETNYSQFLGTFVDNEEEVGLNAPGCHCACGKYKDVTLRVTCSLGEAIQALIGYDTTQEMQL